MRRLLGSTRELIGTKDEEANGMGSACPADMPVQTCDPIRDNAISCFGLTLLCRTLQRSA